jgi:hypothetical protein
VLHRVKKEPPRSCRRPCPNPPSRALVSSSEQNARTSLDSLRRREMGVAVHHGVQTSPFQSWAWSPESELHLTVPSPGRGAGHGAPNPSSTSLSHLQDEADTHS